MASQVVKLGLTLGSTAVLARLLTPAEFGLVAMVTTVTGFAALFRDLGLSAATVQRRDVTHEQISGLFWVNVVVSFVLALVIALLSPVIAWFYDEPRLRSIALLLSATFVLGGLTAQHQALMGRRMRFGSLAAIDVGTLTVGATVGVVLAWSGASYWSIVGMAIAGSVTNCALVWALSGWRPSRPVRGAGIRPLLTFGGHVTGFNLANYFARNIDNVLLGWWWGSTAVGLYSKAYQLLMFPISQINVPISSVMLPALSRLQDDPGRYKSYYFGGLRLLAMLGMPLVVLCYVATEEIIRLGLGPGWTGSVPIFRALAPGAFVGTLNVASGWVYLSLGRTDRMLRWALIGVPIVVMALALGAPFGALGVAVGCSVGLCLSWGLGVAYCYQGTFLSLTELFRAVWLPAAASIGAGAAAILVGSLTQGPATVEKVLTFLLVLGLAWGVLPGGRAWLRQCGRAVKGPSWAEAIAVSAPNLPGGRTHGGGTHAGPEGRDDGTS